MGTMTEIGKKNNSLNGISYWFEKQRDGMHLAFGNKVVAQWMHF